MINEILDVFLVESKLDSTLPEIKSVETVQHFLTVDGLKSAVSWTGTAGEKIGVSFTLLSS